MAICSAINTREECSFSAMVVLNVIFNEEDVKHFILGLTVDFINKLFIKFCHFTCFGILINTLVINVVKLNYPQQ